MNTRESSIGDTAACDTVYVFTALRICCCYALLAVVFACIASAHAFELAARVQCEQCNHATKTFTTANKSKQRAQERAQVYTVLCEICRHCR
jgi:hypothetical protein